MAQVDRAVRAALSHLERLLRESGDNEAANIVGRILQSPEKIAALHQTFASNLKRRAGDDLASHERRLWFQNFSSRLGDTLDEQQVRKLTTVTKNWALSDDKIDSLLSCSLLWSSYPTLFWDGSPPNTDVFRRCFDDLERIREIQPLRRRVLLVILSEHVQCEQKRMHLDGKRQRSRSTLPKSDAGSVQRNRMFLPLSLRAIMRRVWPDIPAGEQRKLKKLLSLYSRFGWKWQQVKPEGMILSLPDSAARSFERHSWSSLEFDAINHFLKTLPQFRIQAHLRRALKSLTSYYYAVPQSAPGPCMRPLTASTDAADNPEGRNDQRRYILSQSLPLTSPRRAVSSVTATPDLSTSGDRPRPRSPSISPVQELYLANQGRSGLSHEQERTVHDLPTTRSISCGDEPRISDTPISPMSPSGSPEWPAQFRSDSAVGFSTWPYQTLLSPAVSETCLESHSVPEPVLDFSAQCRQLQNTLDPAYDTTGASDLQQQILPSQIDDVGERPQLYNCYGFNDTSFALQGISDVPFHLTSPQFNDTTVAMHLFASAADCHDGTGRVIYTDISGVENNPRRLHRWMPNDTSAALFGIIPQPEITSALPDFNDTSIAMAAFGPETLCEESISRAVSRSDMVLLSN